MERAARISLAIAALAAAASVAFWWMLRPSDGDLTETVIPGELYDFRIEVLNATTRLGLARDATGQLRELGVDVVYYGTARDQDLDSTRIIVRRGDSVPASIIRELMGRGLMEIDLDSSLLLEVTVLLGADVSIPFKGNP